MKIRIGALFLTIAMILSLSACGSLPSGLPWGSAQESDLASAEVSGAESSTEEIPEEPDSFEVRFDPGEGVLVSGELVQTVEAGGAASAPEVQRSGYVFDGWDASFEDIQADLVVTAQWAPLFRISFDPAGGAVLSGEIEQRVREGQEPVPPEVERKDSIFQGWSPEVVPATENTVYVAQWTAQKLDPEEIYARVSPGVVEVAVYEPGGEYYGLGSGFFIDDEGTFVTNYHVIDGTVSGEITLEDGSVHDITGVKAYDETLDLAIVQADVTGNAFLTISEQPVRTGETVYAIGSSEGLTGTFSDGIVSTASRDLEGVKCIQITAPISHGNSGGPLVNVYGQVVGINSMSLVEGQNLNFAIDVVELEQLNETDLITLSDLYDIKHPEPEASVSEDEGFYADADGAELEPNDNFLLADDMESGAWIAGEVADVDDMDWFCFTVDAPCDVSFEVAPYYKSDLEYMLCGILELTDNGIDVKDALMPGSEGEYDVSHTGVIHFDEPGIYFLMICVDETYEYDEPLYYVARAVW